MYLMDYHLNIGGLLFLKMVNHHFLSWTGACKALDKCEDLWDEYNQKYDGYDYDKND